jgi:hypothetical protein
MVLREKQHLIRLYHRGVGTQLLLLSSKQLLYLMRIVYLLIYGFM